jgi:hypothetical protein
VIRFRLLSFYSRKNSLWYLVDRRLGGPRSRSENYGEEKNLLLLSEIKINGVGSRGKAYGLHPACGLS